jgi:hypothetical protein
MFGGRDLHHIDVLKDFSAEFGKVYYRLLIKAYGQ